MSDEVINNIEEYLADLVKRNFYGLRTIATPTPTADIYLDTIGGQPVVIKRFQPDYKDNFERELCALQALQRTGRVCPIIFHSKHLQGYNLERFNKVYFIVKPYYQAILQVEHRNPLKLIERAAQEVDISERLLEEGWRDLDGGFSNDALDEECRLLRIDLDTLMPSWAYPEKFDGMYQTRWENQTHNKLREIHRKKFCPEAEIDSLAIRLSRFLLDEKVQSWGLKDRVLSLRESDNESKLRLTRFLHQRLNRLLFNSTKKEWMAQWKNSLAPTGGMIQTLSKEEAAFLGELFFNILRNRDHGFTLRDLYLSLMLLDLAALQTRYIKAREENFVNALEQLTNILSSLYEVKYFVNVIEPSSPAKEPIEAPPGRELKLEYKFNGKAWPSISKGPDWDCQDMVLVHESDSAAIFLLADGATLAGGAQAIKSVKDVFEKWRLTFRSTNLRGVQEQLRNLTVQVHNRLISLGEQNAKPFETTAVIGALFIHPTEPTAVLTRLGNSGFFVTHQNINGGLGYLERSARRNITDPLGSFKLDLNKSLIFQTVPLKNYGIYRIRAFSDGIGEEETAEDLLSDPRSISQLVDEVGSWAEKNPNIGNDDWSLAGFDISVQEAEIEHAPSPVVETATIPGLLNLLEQINDKRFTFSLSAQEFWKRVLTEEATNQLSTYPLIQQVFGFSGPIQPLLPAQKISHPVIQQEIQQGKRAFLVVMSLAVIILSIMIYLENKHRTDLESIPPSSQGASTTVTRPRPVNVEDPFGIYDRLSNNREYVLYDAYQSGQIAGGGLWEKNLSSLANILNKTQWKVEVEVHTDLSGDKTANKKRSEDRAILIYQKLLSTRLVKEDQVKWTAKGEDNPLIPNEKGEKDAKQNRRIIIKRID